MQSLSFHPLSVNDRDTYEHYYQKSQIDITDYTFNCRLAWDGIYHNEFSVFEDTGIILSDGGIYSDPFVFLPMGELDGEKLEGILLAVHEEFKKRGWAFQVFSVGEEKLPLFDHLKYFEKSVSFQDSASDYVYEAKALQTLAGNKLHKKRNHVNKFLRTYPDFAYTSLSPADFNDCLSLVENWCKSKEIDPLDLYKSDYCMIKLLFEAYDKVDVKGGVLRVNEKVCAFALGSKGNQNSAFIHFEKADAAMEGSYAVINQLVLQNEFPDVEIVNREEDLGIPGLRKAKQSYFPIRMLRKYKINLTPIGS